MTIPVSERKKGREGEWEGERERGVKGRKEEGEREHILDLSMHCFFH